jgi:diacylglycerol kinase (CTP)
MNTDPSSKKWGKPYKAPYKKNTNESNNHEMKMSFVHSLASEIKALKKKSDVHWARKIWHMLGVSFIAAMYIFLPRDMAIILLVTSMSIFIPVDFLRQTRPRLNEWAVHVFRAIIRRTEVNRLAGTTFLLTGVAVVTSLFQYHIVVLTLLFLAFADPIASYIGIRFGKDKIFGHKSVQGFFAAFVVCTVITFTYLFYNGLFVERLFLLSLIAGLCGALAELVPIGKLDDNLTLPILSACSLWVLFTLFSGATV